VTGLPHEYRQSWKSSLSHHEFLICTNTNGQA
jgi:hypothetical protein